MIVFRIAKEQFKTDLSGKGAEIAGGRWNSKGVAVLYTSASRALCMAEVLVHLPSGKLAHDFYLITIEIPDDASISDISIGDLPPNWRDSPPPYELKKIGDKFIQAAEKLVLMAPSAVVPGDKNLLINPKHTDFHRVKIVEVSLFEFDPRLLK